MFMFMSRPQPQGNRRDLAEIIGSRIFTEVESATSVGLGHFNLHQQQCGAFALGDVLLRQTQTSGAQAL